MRVQKRRFSGVWKIERHSSLVFREVEVWKRQSFVLAESRCVADGQQLGVMHLTTMKPCTVFPVSEEKPELLRPEMCRNFCRYLCESCGMIKDEQRLQLVHTMSRDSVSRSRGLGTAAMCFFLVYSP